MNLSKILNRTVRRASIIPQLMFSKPDALRALAEFLNPTISKGVSRHTWSGVNYSMESLIKSNGGIQWK